jgi:hypothetical protein
MVVKGATTGRFSSDSSEPKKIRIQNAYFKALDIWRLLVAIDMVYPESLRCIRYEPKGFYNGVNIIKRYSFERRDVLSDMYSVKFGYSYPYHAYPDALSSEVSRYMHQLYHHCVRNISAALGGETSIRLGTHVDVRIVALGKKNYVAVLLDTLLTEQARIALIGTEDFDGDQETYIDMFKLQNWNRAPSAIRILKRADSGLEEKVTWVCNARAHIRSLESRVKMLSLKS